MNDCPFRYQGQYLDQETGLYYNRFRYYDPEVGNYISQDPIGLAGGGKFYSYVHNTNNWLDVLGLLKTVLFPSKQVIYETTIQKQGSNNLDFKAANDNVRLLGKRGAATGDAHKQILGDVVWHHASYDPVTNQAVMQLVTTPDHRATFPHEGAVSQFMKANDLDGDYGTATTKKKAKELNDLQNKKIKKSH